MEILSKAIIQHKKLIIILFVTATIICGLLQFGVSVNYNMVDYLPESAQSTEALKIMESEFKEAIPNARIMLRNVTIAEALEYKEKLEEIDGVSEILWLDDIIDLKVPIEMVGAEMLEGYYKDNNALLSITIREGEEVPITEEIYKIIGDEHALAGVAVDRAETQGMANTETMKAMLILVPVIILILIISTSSWIEPLLFLGAIGISVLINMGTNIIFDEISFITKAVSPILQLAVSLDYAIFLLHSFEKFRGETEDVNQAMELAIKKSFPAIAASAATTLFGFSALVLMKFQIGADLGINLAKGIVLSFISVVVFLPALTLSCYHWIDKTKRRKILPEFKNVNKVVNKIKLPVLILVFLLIVPSFMAQRENDFIYGTGELSPNSRSGQDAKAINEEFGKSVAVVLLVPKGDVVKEQMLGEKLKNLEKVTTVLSYAETVGRVIPAEFLEKAITDQFYSENYSRIIAYTNTAEEGEEAFALVEEIHHITHQYYGDDFYSSGQSVTLYDMKNVVIRDNLMVNIAAIIAIFMVLMVTFKSISLPIILLLTIQSAIWINLSVPYFAGNPLCYIGYLVISTVQLGATVDYAILLSSNYMVNRKKLGKKAAIAKTLGDTFSSILISATILSLAGITLWLTSSNPIVAEMGTLIGRGTILSMLLVVAFLPALLVTFDGVVGKTSYRSEFLKGDRNYEEII
ncbi:efflux RND transporter permease subunit [Alkaliphilus transvaalensis]|uniref:efflux RND transporter permease subunit n=1 Tax=Alkaliphilus transvaalensis TaxID=114628 RepID=UPI000479856C|nr:MMPL family transporter [Alkaliphilus transvaalensis]